MIDSAYYLLIWLPCESSADRLFSSNICLFDLILYVPSPIFWCQWDSNPWPLGLESSNQPRSHCASFHVISSLNWYLNFFLASNDIVVCKHFGPRSGLTECRSSSRFKQFDTLIVFLKEILEKSIAWKNTKHAKCQHGEQIWKCLQQNFNGAYYLLTLLIYAECHSEHALKTYKMSIHAELGV